MDTNIELGAMGLSSGARLRLIELRSEIALIELRSEIEIDFSERD